MDRLGAHLGLCMYVLGLWCVYSGPTGRPFGSVYVCFGSLMCILTHTPFYLFVLWTQLICAELQRPQPRLGTKRARRGYSPASQRPKRLSVVHTPSKEENSRNKNIADKVAAPEFRYPGFPSKLKAGRNKTLGTGCEVDDCTPSTPRASETRPTKQFLTGWVREREMLCVPMQQHVYKCPFQCGTSASHVN